ncbi:MAG: hypothetical protein JXA14_21795 [Anaerolineae bacterium]|nr:hypothetical protein [Anaerolineae bacterium]
MRATQTFVLRLLANSDEPQTLRGMLHIIASGEEEPFADESALLALLRRMMSTAPENTFTNLEEKET